MNLREPLTGARPFPVDAHNADRNRRVVLKGGTIASMDPAVGNFASGDILIEGDRIAAIGAAIETDAPIIDAAGMIVIPGFCDPHIHAWQGNLPRIVANQLGDNRDIQIAPDDPRATQSYTHVMHQTFSHHYRPEDIYAGTLMSLVAALNGGITTVVDNAHNTRSPEHSDASVQALVDSGVRGVHAYGRARVGVSAEDYPADIYRLKRDYFSSEDQLHTLRLWVRGDDAPERFEKVLEARAALDCWISIDTGLGIKPVVELYRDGWFDGRESINHGNYMSLEQMKAVAEYGGTVNVCPRIESQFRYGDIPYQAWRDVGLKPAMSNDDPATYAINMFQEMRTLYAHQRAATFRLHAAGEGGLEKLATVAEMLEAATVRGAACCGLSDKVGSLTPGKQADIVLIDTDNIQLFPKHNVYCTVVQGGDVGFVDTVFVAGKIVKRNGKLTGIDFANLKQLVAASRDYLFEAANWPRPKVDFAD
jgi:cytosine/adenosine deaminase-related metal-dependent hydrolase